MDYLYMALCGKACCWFVVCEWKEWVAYLYIWFPYLPSIHEQTTSIRYIELRFASLPWLWSRLVDVYFM